MENKELENELEEDITETDAEVLAEDVEAGEEENENTQEASEIAENSETAEDSEVEAGSESGTASGKKGVFGKKKEKKDKKTQQIEELDDKLKRAMAEFDNFRKRTEKEKAGMYESGSRSVIEKLLPIVDNFERAFKDITEEQMADPFVDGMDKVFKQLMTMFDEIGVKPIEAAGEEFNPDFHNAVMHVEDENFGENVVAEEFQKGYIYKDTVIRHSMVKVAN